MRCNNSKDMIKFSKNKLGISIKNIEKNNMRNNSCFLNSLYSNLGINYPKFFKMDSLCKLGVIGTELLYKENQELFMKKNRIGIIFQNKSSSLDSDIKHQECIDNNIVSPSIFVYTLPNILIAEISIKYQWNSEGVFFVGKELDHTLLSQYSNVLLKENRTEINLIGWIDVINHECSLSLYIIDSIIKAEELEKRLI